jgi:hypothetical protein
MDVVATPYSCDLRALLEMLDQSGQPIRPGNRVVVSDGDDVPRGRLQAPVKRRDLAWSLDIHRPQTCQCALAVTAKLSYLRPSDE